jgi:glucose/arabinose dehydrogenase
MTNMNGRRIVLGLCLFGCFATGVAFDRAIEKDFRKYFGVDFGTFIKSPLAWWHVERRGWDSFKTLQYTQDHGGVNFHRYVETELLPLNVDGTRLSDVHPVPKNGGAITVVGSTVIIVDRLGGLYRYDLKTRSFGMLPGVPRLPNNLENLQAFLLRRPGPPVDLADAPNDEFRARSIIFISDRKALAIAYDKFDEAIGKIRTVVSLISFDPTTLTATGAWQEIFVSDAFEYGPGNKMGGGQMAYRGDGKLYVTLGDHGIFEPNVAEDPSTTFGKIIQLDLTTNKWRLFTKGHRNQEGLAFLKSGQLLSTENGPYGGDELNVITEGSDYGNSTVTLGTAYNSYDSWATGKAVVGRHAGYKAPLFAWVPSIAPTQLIEVTNFSPRWDGDLLIGTMKASSLYRLRLEDGHVLYSERIWMGQRVRDIAQTGDGTIVLWTDDTQLLFVTVDQDQLAMKRRTPNVVGSIVNEVCLSCHHFGSTSPADFGPSLSNLLNRRIASDAFSYSSALRAKQSLGRWTPALLSEFLSDTYKFAPGTIMAPFQLDPALIKDIVDVLVQASDRSAGLAQSPPEPGSGVAQ